jgi:hypothetical protein
MTIPITRLRLVTSARAVWFVRALVRVEISVRKKPSRHGERGSIRAGSTYRGLVAAWDIPDNDTFIACSVARPQKCKEMVNARPSGDLTYQLRQLRHRASSRPSRHPGSMWISVDMSDSAARSRSSLLDCAFHLLGQLRHVSIGLFRQDAALPKAR